MSYFVFIISAVMLIFFIGLKFSHCNWNNIFINSIDGWLRIYCRYYHRFKFQPILIPNNEAAIIVCNHISGLDPLLLIAAMKRPVRFLIASEEYNRFGLRWLFRAGGCIPIERGGNVTRAMSAAISALNNGEIIAIFPEGFIQVETDPPIPLKRGVSVLAEASGAMIYPVHLSGIGAAGYVLLSIIFPSHAKLISGDSINCVGESHSDCLKKITTVLRPN